MFKKFKVLFFVLVSAFLVMIPMTTHADGAPGVTYRTQVQNVG